MLYVQNIVFFTTHQMLNYSSNWEYKNILRLDEHCFPKYGFDLGSTADNDLNPGCNGSM